MEGAGCEKRGRGRPPQRWIQDTEDAFELKAHRAGKLARERNTFRRAVRRATLFKGLAD